MAKRNRQGVCGIRTRDPNATKLKFNHMFHLLLLRVSDSNHNLLHRIGRVFRHAQTRLSRNQQRNAARLPQLQCSNGVLVDKCFFHRSGIRVIIGNYLRKLIVKCAQTTCQFTFTGFTHPIGHMNHTVAGHIHESPAEEPKAWINSQNPHRPRSRTVPACKFQYHLP